MIVDFAIIGAQKSGTTSLASQLASHPEICFCHIKEPGFFNKPRSANDEVRYHARFDPKPNQLCGEASTMYTFFPEYRGTAERMAAYNPCFKLLYIMRDPVERIRSHYSHRLVRRTVTAPLAASVLEDPTYVNRSRYAVQLRPFLESFPRHQICLLVFEEYLQDPQRTLLEVANFLAVDPAFFISAEAAHEHDAVAAVYLPSGVTRLLHRVGALSELAPRRVKAPLRRLLGRRLATRPTVPDDVRDTLWRLLEDDRRAIEALLGRTIDAWGCQTH